MTNWTPAVDISKASISLGPAVAANASEIAAIYNLGTVNVKEVYFTKSSDGVNWTTPLKIGPNNGSTTGSSPIQLLALPTGGRLALWQDFAEDERHLFINSCNSSEQWGTPHSITQFNTNGVSAAIASDGSIHISYARIYTGGTDAQVEYMRSSDGGQTWSSPQTVDARGLYTNQTAITVVGNVPIICYERGQNNNFTIYSQAYMNGAWQSAITVGPEHSFWPQLASNGTDAVLVHQLNSGGSSEIYLRRWQASSGWSSAVNVSNSPGLSVNPSVAYAADGTAHVAWGDVDGAGGLILKYASVAANGTVSPSVSVSPSRSTGVDLALGGGKLHLIYQHDGSGDWRIYYRSLAVSPPPPPPPPTQYPVDIAGNIFEQEIKDLYDMGIVRGTDATHYSPHLNVTRDQMAHFIRATIRHITGQ